MWRSIYEGWPWWDAEREELPITRQSALVRSSFHRSEYGTQEHSTFEEGVYRLQCGHW